MSKLEEGCFTIEFTSSAIVQNMPENFLAEIKGRILYQELESGNADSLLAGKLRAFYVDIEGAIEHDEDLSDIFDLEYTTEPFYLALFDPKTNEFNKYVRQPFGRDVIDDSVNLLILDRLEILPEYRGEGLGLACLYRCMQQYQHGCGIVAMKPFPLQFEPVRGSEDDDPWRQSLNLKAFGRDEKACTKKLESYYRRLGFKILGTGVMAAIPHYAEPLDFPKPG